MLKEVLGSDCGNVVKLEPEGACLFTEETVVAA